MLAHLIFRYVNRSEELDLCSFLDPRVKKLVYLSTQERIIIHDKLVDMIANDALMPHVASERGDFSQPLTSQDKSEPVGLQALLPQYGEADSDRDDNGGTPYEMALVEVKHYVATKGCDMTKCPLVW